MDTCITKDEKGTYHWIGTIHGQCSKKTGRIVYSVMGGLCILFIGMALVINPDMIWATLLSSLGILAIVTIVAVPYLRAMKGRKQSYEMNEKYVRYVGYGKEDAVFSYESIRKVRVYTSRNMLEVKGAIVSAPFFVPQEGFDFVKGYILQRLPNHAEILYEQ